MESFSPERKNPFSLARSVSMSGGGSILVECYRFRTALPDFIHSNYCTEKEMQHAFERAKSGACNVVAVILEACQWTSIPIASGGELGDFLALPRDGKAVDPQIHADRRR